MRECSDINPILRGTRRLDSARPTHWRCCQPTFEVTQYARWKIYCDVIIFVIILAQWTFWGSNLVYSCLIRFRGIF